VTDVVAVLTLRRCFVVRDFAQFAQRSRVVELAPIVLMDSMQPGSRDELPRNTTSRGLVLKIESHARRLSERFDSVDDRRSLPLILPVSPTT
jgi:hypothetical protein